ncbi:MAG TPA: sugar ABC transporter substrate-binding protein [Candidatus Eisenbacteria bacterium]|nr:sugar ABC transporter substrate-binding protein [Candidatus Eisenbacteria bacterium]
MGRLKFLISLMTKENDYQLEQAHAAELAATRLGLDIDIIYADNDAITQSTQILRVIQSDSKDRPQAIVFEPVGGTALPQVAQAALNAGMGWALINRDAPYLRDFRRTAKAPIFGVSSDQVEVGRISARQCAALLPGGGSILYIQGPSHSDVSRERESGMQQAKPANIHVSVLKGQWTEESARRAVTSWLNLSTSLKTKIDLVLAQNDAMAIGARNAFQGIANEVERERWLTIPFLGVDGVPKTGQAWVRSGLLKATIVTPPSTGLAMEIMADALLKKKPQPERTFTEAISLPAIDSLRPAK